MKIIINIARILTGVLFIISGLIKLNDPVGFSFKLKEYFGADVLNMEFLIPFALAIAIFVVIYEVMLGITLLLGYAKKITLWGLFLMILFFTFLTFYSAYFNKVTDCGCFGDAIKLTPWESFTKDLVLLVLILILFWGKKYIQPIFAKSINNILVLISFILCLWFGYHVLMHLPVKDFRPYKIGANITEGMSYPENAAKPIFDYHWTFTHNGNEKTIVTQGSFPDEEGKYTVETKMVQAGYEPPIHDFTMEHEGEDFTAQLLEEEKMIVIVSYSLSDSEKEGFHAIREITNKALKKGYKVIGLSASSQEVTEALAEEYKLNFKFYFCDETALKTVIRSNPAIMEIQKGTIMQKLHWNDAEDLKLEMQKGKDLNFNPILKKQLDSVLVKDGQFRKLLRVTSSEKRKLIGEKMGLKPTQYNGDLQMQQETTDSLNMIFIESVINKHGIPGKSLVGEASNTIVLSVLQHFPNKISNYIQQIKNAAKEGEIPLLLANYLEDKYLVNEGEYQIYGTQGMDYEDDRIPFIWPIKNPKKVNELRLKVGYTKTIEEYSKSLFGKDFKYKVLTLEDVNNY